MYHSHNLLGLAKYFSGSTVDTVTEVVSVVCTVVGGRDESLYLK